jgi:hypothetical protein
MFEKQIFSRNAVANFFLPQERKKNIFRVNLKLSLLKNRWFGYFTNKVTFKQGLPSLLPPSRRNLVRRKTSDHLKTG